VPEAASADPEHRACAGRVSGRCPTSKAVPPPTGAPRRLAGTRVDTASYRHPGAAGFEQPAIRDDAFCASSSALKIFPDGCISVYCHSRSKFRWIENLTMAHNLSLCSDKS
jgi:hypothetical protein